MSTLILYDVSGQWGWLGEIYAIMTANLASHFGTWTASPVQSYQAGQMSSYTGVVYVGSTYGEPIPSAFLSDVLANKTPVIWIYDNIWQLTAAAPNFTQTYGWNWSQFDYSTVGEVDYKGQKLKRYSGNANGIMAYATVGSTVTVLANCVRSDGTTFPWAVRSQNLTYVGEIPFAYFSEGDRYLAFCDFLFDLLAPSTATRHRAFVRLEDINPSYDPQSLKQVADYLSSANVPFGFHISPRYLDPNGVYNNGTPQDIPLSSAPDVVSALKYMMSKGGVMIEHGYTHQYSNIDNPYTAVTGDDCEFFRITEDPTTHLLTYVGPLPGDSQSWAQGRFDSAAAELTKSGLAVPTMTTFPSYSASYYDYLAELNSFSVRAERVLYYSGMLSGNIDQTRYSGQFFPYTVRDVYSTITGKPTKVLADTLGGIQPQAYFSIPPRLPADLIADAQRTLVVRDGVASFFYNPEDDVSYLQQTVQGLQKLGYKFVSPTSL